jgi:hypothetical protein
VIYILHDSLVVQVFGPQREYLRHKKYEAHFFDGMSHYLYADRPSQDLSMLYRCLPLGVKAQEL